MNSDPSRSRSPETAPSSGAHTPPTLVDTAVDTADAAIAASSAYISTMWTGLVRRLTAEETALNSQPQPGSQSSQHSFKDGISDVFVPTRRTASPFRPPPLDPIVLHGHTGGTRFLSSAVAEEIRSMVPERLRIVEDWRLAYSLERDGASLATLYQNCRAHEDRRVGFVLAVKDQEGAVFGAYLSENPRPAPSYFGNGECFLWRASTLASLPPPPSADTTNLNRNTMLHPRHTRAPSDGRPNASPSPAPSETIRFKAFPYSGLNDFCINCESGFLSVGSGGGHYGLWLDDSLAVGRSARCETFGNEPLSDEGGKFGVIGVEVWAIGG